MLCVIIFSEPVLVPVSDQALRVVRILVHGFCRMYVIALGLISTNKLNY